MGGRVPDPGRREGGKYAHRHRHRRQLRHRPRNALGLARRGFDLGITRHSDEENLDEAVAEFEAEGVRVETRRVDLSDVPGPTR
jgi:hypothetical protein